MSTTIPGLEDVFRTQQELYDGAWREQRWGDALEVVTRGLFFRCLAMLTRLGCNPGSFGSRRPLSHGALAEFESEVQSMDQASARFPLACVSELRSLYAVLEGIEETQDERTRVARLVTIGERIGRLGAALARAETGEIQRIMALERTRERLASQKGREALWEARFTPVAAKFCHGREKVSLGALVREARRWSDAERAEGRNPGLPGTDDGIERGIKRMEKRGALTIPGRPNTRGGGAPPRNQTLKPASAL